MTSIGTPVSKKTTTVLVVRTDIFSPALGSPSPVGPRVVPGNTEDEEEVGIPFAGVPEFGIPVEVDGVPVLGIPVEGVPVVGVPVVGVPVDGKPLVGVPLVGVPVVGVPVVGVPVEGVPLELEPVKQLEAVEGGEGEVVAAPLKSQVAPEEAFFW
jgi:hypothetical protein